jgi:hypothetical protein
MLPVLCLQAPQQQQQQQQQPQQQQQQQQQEQDSRCVLIVQAPAPRAALLYHVLVPTGYSW